MKYFRKKFSAQEKIRHEGLMTVNERRAQKEEEEEEEEEEPKGGFHSPRPSLYTQDHLVRPSTMKDKKDSQVLGSAAEGGKGSEIGSRQGSITSRLLSMVPPKRRSTTTIRKAVTEDPSISDTLDSAFGRLAVGVGGERKEREANSLEDVGAAPLRKPRLEKK